MSSGVDSGVPRKVNCDSRSSSSHGKGRDGCPSFIFAGEIYVCDTQKSCDTLQKPEGKYGFDNG